MKNLTLALTLILAYSCERKEQKVSDAFLNELREGNPGMTVACVEKVRWEGLTAFPDDADVCFKMTKPKLFRGLWRTDFERSQFCPAPARECSSDTLGDQIWASVSAKATGLPRVKRSEVGVPVLYEVEFIGRKTTVRGYHGHQALYPYEVVIDRMIEMKQIEPAPNN